MKFSVKSTSTKKYYNSSCYITDEYRKKLSDIKKKQLSELTDEQLSERQKRQFGACDQTTRGQNISKGKRGVKTDQNLLEIEKYGKMSISEFEEHIKNRSPHIRSRMINKRQKYNGNDFITISGFTD